MAGTRGKAKAAPSSKNRKSVAPRRNRPEDDDSLTQDAINEPVLTTSAELPLAEGALVSMNVKTSDSLGSSVINISTGNSKVSAQLNARTGTFSQTFKLTSEKPFAFTPMMTRSGIFKGKQVLMLLPDQTPDTTFPFLEFPPEVRNMIYAALLVKPNGQACHVSGKQVKYLRCDAPKGLELLRCNKQVYHEAAAIFYGANIFDFSDTTCMTFYLTHIGSCVKHLRQVKIDTLVKNTGRKAGVLLAAATQLTSLELNPSSSLRRTYYGYGGESDFSHFLSYAFQPVFEALYKTLDDHGKVFDVLRLKGVKEGCQRNCSLNKWSQTCYCLTKEGVLEDLRSYVFGIKKSTSDDSGAQIDVPNVAWDELDSEGEE